MQINTRKTRMTKREQQTLRDAMTLFRDLEANCPELAYMADGCAMGIRDAIEALGIDKVATATAAAK